MTTLTREPLLTTREVADVLGVGVELVRRLVDAGVLPVVRYGPRSRFRFRESDVAEVLRPQRRTHDDDAH